MYKKIKLSYLAILAILILNYTYRLITSLLIARGFSLFSTVTISFIIIVFYIFCFVLNLKTLNLTIDKDEILDEEFLKVKKSKSPKIMRIAISINLMFFIFSGVVISALIYSYSNSIVYLDGYESYLFIFMSIIMLLGFILSFTSVLMDRNIIKKTLNV